MINACVIGWPIAHSLSPVIHGFWLESHRISGSYKKLPVKPEDLQAFLHNLERAGFSGCNITLPHKEKAAQLVEIADDLSRHLGSINTIYLENGCLKGISTDGTGFCAHLHAEFPDWQIESSRIVILGAGGAARAIAGTLSSRHPSEIVVANRTLARAEILAKKFGRPLRAVAWNQVASELRNCDLLINSTSLGMQGQPPLDISLKPLNPKAIVADIVYNPLETALLCQAKSLQLQTLDGLGMLLHQAVPGFYKWFGVRPEVTDELRDAVLAALDAH